MIYFHSVTTARITERNISFWKDNNVNINSSFNNDNERTIFLITCQKSTLYEEEELGQ